MRAIVSTLIPAYYAEEWVGAAIGSALGPIWRQKENIVVDHGSTDGTLAGARQFESDEVRGGKQPTQEPAAASIPSAGDKANPAELKDDSET
jgi:glycosyltransferase involved in cell wall biosynthesis